MKIKVWLLVVTLAVPLLTVSSTAISPVSAEKSANLFMAEDVEGIGAAFGCMSAACPTERRTFLGFVKQSRYPELASASRIVTVPVPNLEMETTGCAVIETVLKCFGKNTFGRLGNETSGATTDAFVTATRSGVPLSGITDIDISGETTCAIQNQKILCIGRDELTPSEIKIWNPSSPPTWFEMPSEPAVQLQLFVHFKAPDTQLPASQVPLLCARFASLRVGCSWVNQMPNWKYLDVKDVLDIDGVHGEHSMQGTQLCFAGKKSGCFEVRLGVFGEPRYFSALNDASRVYWKGNAVLFYKAGALYSVPQRGGPESFLAPHMIGYMEEPLASIFKPGGFEQTIVTKGGFISVPSSALGCDDCYTNAQGILSPMTAFSDASSSTYYSVESVDAVSDSMTYMPITISTGTRRAGVKKKLKLRTYSGEVVAGALVTWRSPDVALGLSGSEGSAIVGRSGEFSVTANTGPLTFSIVGGAVKSGANLQGAYVTRLFDSGMDTKIEVPDPDVLIDRKITVVDSTGQPVPNAEVTLSNSYLAYTFSTRGIDTAVWGAQPQDPRGFFLEPQCVFCYVPPPAYVTGIDGTITFRSFDAKSKSSISDARIGYDDGILKKSVEHNFSSGEDTVVLPDMPTLVSSATDTNINTSEIDLVPDAQGATTIEVGLTSGTAGSSMQAVVETVCEQMETGSLWRESLNVNDLCQGKAVGTVKSQGIKCPVSSGGSVKSETKTTIKLCATTSTRVRIRANGAVAGRSICIVVRGKPCTTHSLVVGKTKTILSTNKIVKRSSKLPLARYLPATSGTSATYVVTRPCIIKKGVLQVPSKPGACVVTKIELATARNLKGKSSVVRIPIVIK